MRGERAGGDRVAGDAVAGTFHRDDGGERGDARLRGAVVGLAEVAEQTRRRRGADDVAGALGLAPVAHGRAGGQEVAAEVDADHGVPVVLGHLGDRPVAEDARVVDQGVQAAELADGRGDERVGHVGVGHITVDGDSPAPGGDDLLDDGLAHGLVVLRHHHGGALVRALQRLAAADATARAGDDHDLVVEKSHGAERKSTVK